MQKVIHVFGASGTGATTLGRAIHRAWGHVHCDTDDYFWLPTDPPYTTPRARELRQAMLEEELDKSPSCVITGSLCGWGDVLIPRFQLCIWLDTPEEVRMERLRKRELAQFGERILPGGDMYENHLEFIEWAKSYDTAPESQRSRAMHQAWCGKLGCPVLILDGSEPVETLLRQVEAQS